MKKWLIFSPAPIEPKPGFKAQQQEIEFARFIDDPKDMAEACADRFAVFCVPVDFGNPEALAKIIHNGLFGRGR